jgi:Protein of unknown function (DUF4089)
MQLKPETLEAFMDTQAALLGLPLLPEHRPGVLRYLQLVAGMAPAVMNLPLTPADESGNVFQVVPAAPATAATALAPGAASA